MEKRYVDWAKAKQTLAGLRPASFFNTRSMGFMLQRAWVFLLFLNAGSLVLAGANAPLSQGIYLVSALSLCAVLFIAAAKPEGFASFMTQSARRWTGPVLTSLGSLLAFLFYVGLLPLPAIAVCAGALTGIGSGIIDLGYGEIYRNRPPEETNIEVPFATLVAAALFACVLAAPAVAWAFSIIVLPLASGCLLLASNHVWQPGNEPTVQPVGMDVAKFTWRIGVCAAVVGIADGLVRQVYLHIMGLAPEAVESFFGVGMVLSCAIMFVLFFAYQLLAREPSYRSLYKLVVFVMAFLFLLMPITYQAYNNFTSTFVLLTYNSYNVLIWLVLADLAYRYRLSSLRVFGIGWGMVTLGVAVGQAVSSQLIAMTPEFTNQQLSLIVLIAAFVTLGSYLFVLNEDDMEKMTDDSNPGNPDDTGSDSAHEDVEGSAEQGENEKPHLTPFRTRCEQVALRYRLTPRETEVMILFAKGRTSKRIQEELVISRGTVTTHLQHIYQKVGVHSKQELLDLIEDYHPERRS